MLGWRTILTAILGGVLVALGVPPLARAQDRSELEQRMVVRALGPDVTLLEGPQGKRIEKIEVVRLPVFDEDDPVPDFVNALHMQSRESVIRSELLFNEGDSYDADRIKETIRALQLIKQFGVVVIVARPGSDPESVHVVVIVRDVWSLRANYELQGRPSSIDYLLVNLSEDNLLGTLTRVGGLFTLEPQRYSLGALLAHPRLFGTKVDTLATSSVFLNLDSGKPEGSYGTVAVYQDIVALRDRFGFIAGAAWRVEQTRVFQNRRLVLSEQGIPIEYGTRVVRAGAQLSRAFGTEQRSIGTTGLELSRRLFRADQRPQDGAEEFAAFVRDELPVSDTRLSPFVQLEQRTSRYLTTRDVETLSLEESFVLGEWAALRLYPALQRVGSSRDLIGAVAWAGYTLRLDSGFARLLVSSTIEHAAERKDQASAQSALRIVTPRFGFARLVLDYAGVSVYRNYLNRKLALGGETRPRGYKSQTFRGASAYAGSLELRTSAVNVLSARLGAVLFYDVGGAADTIEQVRPHQSVGAGLRILFPQVNRAAFRIDWAAPLTASGAHRSPNRALPGGVYFAFGQAFDLPVVKLPSVLGADTSLLEAAQ